jgi:hypothetical protein
MLFLEPQHISNLLITQRRLPLVHLPRNRTIWRKLLEKLSRRERRSDCVVRRVEHLKPKPIFLHAQITNLTQVPCVDITPRIPLAHARIANVLWEIALVLVRLDDISDPEGVNVGVEAACETAGDTLATEFGDGVCVHGIDVVSFVEREGRVVQVALAEANFVGGFGGCDDYFLDAEFAGGFDDVVGAGYVAAVAFVVLGSVNIQIWRIAKFKGRTGTNMFRAYAAKWMTASGGLALLGPS